MKRIVGNSLQTAGFGIWLLSGLVSLLVELWVIYQSGGVLGLLASLFFFPVAYVASVLIVWFSTGFFPWGLAAIWLLGWVGLALASFGARVSEKGP